MKKKLINSQLNSYQTYLMYKRRMISMAQEVFQFKYLPSFIDKYFLNSTLLHNGSIAFFYDDVMEELVALPYTVLGELDLYGRPVKIVVRGFNGRFYKHLDQNEFVIMYDNNGRYPIYLDILQLAERISFCIRTTDVNISHQRTPRVWTTSQDKMLTLKNMINDIDGFQDNILTYESINLDDLNCVLNPAPYVTDKIDLHMKELWSEFYQLIGIANITTSKKERLITDEVAISQGGTIANRFNRFDPRKTALHEINKKWGHLLEHPIEVEYYDGIPSTNDNMIESEEEKNVSTILFSTDAMDS